MKKEMEFLYYQYDVGWICQAKAELNCRKVLFDHETSRWVEEKESIDLAKIPEHEARMAKACYDFLEGIRRKYSRKKFRSTE